MPKKMVLIALVGSSVLMSGCSRYRAFTRGDYSEMQDPFMGGMMDSAESELGDSGAGHTGRASLDSGRTTADVTGQESMSAGPRPIQRVGATADPLSSSGGVSHAVYPAEESGEASGAVPAGRQVIRSYQGPELSGFLQGKSAGEASANSGVTAGNSILQRQTGAPGLPRNSMLSPAAQAAALPGMSAEVEGFNSYLRESSDQITQDAETVVQDAKASAASFSEFAAQKKAQWQQQAQAAPGAAKQTVVQAKDAVRQRKDAFIEQINTGGVVGASAATASPASAVAGAGRAGSVTPAKGEASAAGGAAATSGKASLETSSGTESLENPFAEMPEFSSEADVPEEAAADATFDETFGGDPNWKPKEFTP